MSRFTHKIGSAKLKYNGMHDLIARGFLRRCDFEEPCRFVLGNLGGGWSGACAGCDRLGDETASDLC